MIPVVPSRFRVSRFFSCEMEDGISVMHSKRVNSNHGVMIEVNSTGDSSPTEDQLFQFLQFRNGRWDLCDAQQESAIIMG